jgi:hypothetical protein
VCVWLGAVAGTIRGTEGPEEQSSGSADLPGGDLAGGLFLY